MGVLAVRNFTRTPVSGFPFARTARGVLPDWDISLVFVGALRAKRINHSLRGKTYTPNVLSYALSPHHGEIIICPQAAKKEAHSFNLSPRQFIMLLFIHGLLHLKGYRHGLTMERYERKLLAPYASNPAHRYDTTNCNRN